MRVLYLTAGFPYPLTSGYLRHHHLIRQLSGDHRITLFSLVGRGFEPGHAEAMRPLVDRLRTFDTIVTGVPAKASGRARQLIGAAANDGERAMAAAVRAEIDAGEVDAVVLSGKRTAACLASLGTTPTVIDLCDATSARLRGGLRYAGAARGADQALQFLAMRRVERALVARGDHLLFASERDRRLVLGDAEASTADRVSVVPNGVDLQRWRRRSDRLGADVVFTGALGYGPNEHAALHLVSEVMPRVWRRRPATRLVLVGKEPTDRLRAAAGDDRVTITGFVDDVRVPLEQAAVFAAPLHFGVGIQNKLLEAMAMEVPVVTSTLAADGVRLDGRPPLRTADGPEATAAAVLERLDAAASDPTPDHGARKWLVERFDWARSGSLVDDALRRVATPAEVAPC